MTQRAPSETIIFLTNWRPLISRAGWPASGRKRKAEAIYCPPEGRKVDASGPEVARLRAGCSRKEMDGFEQIRSRQLNHMMDVRGSLGDHPHDDGQRAMSLPGRRLGERDFRLLYKYTSWAAVYYLIKLSS